jgi:ribosomal protein L7/L12
LIDLQDLLAARDRGTKEVMVLLYDFDQQREVAESIAIEEAILIECNALSWRSLAISQEMHEKLGARPLAPAARLEAVFPEVITFKLTDYYPSNKIGVIKALRTLTGKDLKETVEFIADLPAVVSVTNGKYNLQSAKDLLTAAGGVVE